MPRIKNRTIVHTSVDMDTDLYRIAKEQAEQRKMSYGCLMRTLLLESITKGGGK